MKFHGNFSYWNYWNMNQSYFSSYLCPVATELGNAVIEFSPNRTKDPSSKVICTFNIYLFDGFNSQIAWDGLPSGWKNFTEGVFSWVQGGKAAWRAQIIFRKGGQQKLTFSFPQPWTKKKKKKSWTKGNWGDKEMSLLQSIFIGNWFCAQHYREIKVHTLTEHIMKCEESRHRLTQKTN